MPVNTIDLNPQSGGNAGLDAEGHVTSVGRLSIQTTGQAISPAYAFDSERSLGLYRSGTSAVALSYGTLSAPILISSGAAGTSGISSVGTIIGAGLWSVSGISVGSSTNTGTNIPAISSLSSLVGAFVVQGSASSFTGIAWPAARIGDIILTGPFQSTAASSVSSGLIPWSHVTIAGQIEFRLSNVSTLAQNQSAQTWVFTRITPF